MGFKRIARKRRISAAAAAEIALADASSPTETTASAAQEPEEVTAATVAGEPTGVVLAVAGAAEAVEEEGKEPNVVGAEEASVDRTTAAAVDSYILEDARAGQEGMEAEESDEEDPVEVELAVDEVTEKEEGANHAADANEADEYPDEVQKDGDVRLNDYDDVGGRESDDAENDEVDPSMFALDLASEGENKEIQIFVGGMPKDCVEEDITKVFSEFGKIGSVKIVKNSVTNRLNDFAFVRYANTGDAMKALAKFNEGTEVKGKKVHIATSQDNDTLYLGNICKTWTKDQVRSTLKGLGIEEVEMSLPDDPDSGGRNKGFAFVRFALHSDAVAAFQRLRKPDAIFGKNRSAKVSFAQTPLRPSEDLLMKIESHFGL